MTSEVVSSRYSTGQISFLNHQFLSLGVSSPAICSHLRCIELFNIQSLTNLVVKSARDKKQDTPLRQAICQLKKREITTSASDRYRFFRIVILKVRELGVPAKMRPFGPDQIEVWDKQINDRALENIWPRCHALLERDYIKPFLPNNFDLEKARVWKAVEIQKFLRGNPTPISKILFLDLSGLHLKAVPEEMGCFTEVTTLDLCNNQLTMLGKPIRRMPALKILHATKNRIKILSEINFPSLVLLNVNDNQLSTIPREIRQLTSLETLYLSKNKLKKLPSQISELSNLKEFYVGENELVKLPRSMRRLKHLKRISIEKTHIKHPPKWASSLNADCTDNTPLRTYDLRPPKKQKIQ